MPLAVEKALKGLLTWHKISFGKTHDLMVLLALVVEIIPSFDALRPVCEELSEFAVDVRYPGGISEPPVSEAERFVSEAETILGRIKKEMARS
jgi:HEPN domain-containing protein